MATTCFCPTDRVNWDKPGGLCQWNWPCMSKDVFPFYNWYVDDTKETDVIIIPDKEALFPCCWLAMPPFCLLVCIMVPLMEANIFKVYEENGNLTLDYLCKDSCSESIKYSRKKLVSASLDVEEAGIFTSRKLRISLLCDNGMAPDKGQWLIMNSQLDESVLQRCVDLINSKIACLNGRNANAAFAQPVYGFSQQQPLAYGHMQPQVQVQPQVYYFGNSQPQPQLQTANDYGNVQPQLELQLQPQVHYFNNSQPQLQPQFANDNAAFISYSGPQPQQAVYGFSQQQPLVYGNIQPQLQVEPQVHYFNNSQPQLQPQIGHDNAAFTGNPAPQPQQAVYGFSQQQPLVQQLQLQVQPQQQQQQLGGVEYSWQPQYPAVAVPMNKSHIESSFVME